MAVALGEVDGSVGEVTVTLPSGSSTGFVRLAADQVE